MSVVRTTSHIYVRVRVARFRSRKDSYCGRYVYTYVQVSCQRIGSEKFATSLRVPVWRNALLQTAMAPVRRSCTQATELCRNVACGICVPAAAQVLWQFQRQGLTRDGGDRGFFALPQLDLYLQSQA